MPSRTVVILGGGVGGIITANDLRQRLSNEQRIVLVERNAEHAFAPSFLWLMTGDRRPQQVRRPLVQLLRAKGFQAQRLEDGVPEWRAGGLPVAVGEKPK